MILTGYQTKLKSVRISVHIRRPLKFPIVFACLLLMVCSDQQQLEDENTLIFICQLSLKGGGRWETQENKKDIIKYL